VWFSVSGGKARAVARSPYRTALTLKSASKAVVVAQVRLPSARGDSRSKSILATITACP
jgi:hypothetical protein